LSKTPNQRRPGHVRAVPVQSRRVRIRMRNRLVRRVSGIRIVAVADEVDSAFTFGAAGPKGPGSRPLSRWHAPPCTPPACPVRKVGVRVVDTGIDDGDLDAFPVESGRAAPDRGTAYHRNAVRVVGLEELQAGGPRRLGIDFSAPALSASIRTFTPFCRRADSAEHPSTAGPSSISSTGICVLLSAGRGSCSSCALVSGAAAWALRTVTDRRRARPPPWSSRCPRPAA